MRVETLDLSQTTWPELAHPSIVSAITFVARRGMQRYPHLRGAHSCMTSWPSATASTPRG